MPKNKQAEVSPVLYRPGSEMDGPEPMPTPNEPMPEEPVETTTETTFEVASESVVEQAPPLEPAFDPEPVMVRVLEGERVTLTPEEYRMVLDAAPTTDIRQEIRYAELHRDILIVGRKEPTY